MMTKWYHCINIIYNEKVASLYHNRMDFFSHKLSLAAYCRKLLAVELNPSLCLAAEKNLQLNGIHNVKILNCASEKIAKKILYNKKYKDGTGEYSFSTVLVDPPRCGLDVTTCSLICEYEYIIYVSCNPIALLRDLDKVSDIVIW